MDFRKQAKDSRAKKLHQMTVSGPDAKVDSSDFTPYADPQMDKKTGLKPKNPRAFKRGGKVTALEGAKAKKRGDRMGAKGRKGKQVGGGSGASDEDRAALTKMAEESLRQNLRKDEPKVQNTPLPPRRPEAKPEFRAKTDLSSPYKKGGRTKKMMGGDITAGGNPQIPSSKGQTSLLRKAVGLDYKKGGKVHKMNGGPMMAGPAQTLMKRKTPMNNPAAKAPMVMPMRAKGGKVSEMEWEHSKEDLAQDKKLAKKHGMSLEKWEKSAADKKHDKQQSTEGLMCGGRTKKADGGGDGAGLLKYTGPKPSRPGRGLIEANKERYNLNPGNKFPKDSDESFKKLYVEPMEEAENKKSGGRSGGKWIQKAIKKPGALHKQLGVPKGEKIPAEKLEEAAEKGGKLGKRARLAQTLGRMNRASGGRAKKADGGPLADYQAAMDEYLATPRSERKAARGKLADANRAYNQSVAADKDRPQSSRDLATLRLGNKNGGRTKRASGGRAKGKSNINIVIAPQPAAQGGMPPMGMPPRPMMPPPPMPAPGGMPPGGMPPGAMPIPVPMPMGGALAPAPQGAGVPGLPGMAPLPRKSGGRIKSYKDMTAGAGSGEGRLQKEEMAEYKRTARKAGGKVPNMTAGAGSGPGRIEKIHAYGENPHGDAAPKPKKRSWIM